MELKKQFEEETGDSPSFRINPLIETFSHDYVEWLEAKLEQLQNTSSNSDYAKCIRCNDNNRSRLCEKCIDEIRNFAYSQNVNREG